MKTRQRYSPEVRERAVRLVLTDEGIKPGVSSIQSDKLKELEREVRELKRANEILRKAAAFFAQAELDRKPKKW